MVKFTAHVARLLEQDIESNALHDILINIEIAARKGLDTVLIDQEVSVEVIEELQHREFEVEETEEAVRFMDNIFYKIKW